ncbi:MAG TPA: tRNA uridine-5-carboxymethylaminomethyl(34) synthesis GTPase MnmE [Firmicutes bacterium]|nr:tRNA uridine-5-carboxymethylaminomethyl(34) synthesis GTPase MnmE [Bacillota bacterium]
MRGPNEEDTIAAIATPPGEGGIGIVRISGVRAFEIGRRVFRPARKGFWEERGWRVGLGSAVKDSGEVLDECVAVVMPAPRSYTKEDVLEIQCHGGQAVLGMVLETVLNLGARLAEPGEFTQRAFLNGRIDLAQAEAVIDLVRAQTETALRVAVDQLRGSLSRRVRKLRRGLVDMLASIEGSIDFPEDEVPEPERPQLIEDIQRIIGEIDELLSSARQGIIVREGLKVAIVGKPNVGKSSLMNALLGAERAIVTDLPGTTRDVVTEVADINGVAVTLADTAGIRDTKDVVEGVGVERAVGQARAADLVLLVVDDQTGLTAEDWQVREIVSEALKGERGLVVVNKIDAGRGMVRAEEASRLGFGSPVVRVSAKTGAGLDELKRQIVRKTLQSEQVGSGLVTRVRHKRALEEAREVCVRVEEELKGGDPLDLVCVELREAAEVIGRITGENVTEDVIDQIFSTFCVGK